MAETPEKRQVYYIPDNYIKENRIHIGQLSFRLRYLLDSFILTLISGIFGLLFIVLVMKNASVSTKLTVALIICGPGFLLGQIGYNGDPISTAFANFLKWRNTSAIYLYNTTPRLLGSDPVKAMQGPTGRDSIVEAVSNMRESMRRKAEEGELIEGESFAFEYDPSIDDYLEDNGDFESSDADLSTDLIDIHIDSEWDTSDVQYVFSPDGYYEPDEDEINLSDYETN